MNKHAITRWLACGFLLAALAACGPAASSTTVSSPLTNTTAESVIAATPTAAVELSRTTASGANSNDHEAPDDLLWDESEQVQITLNGDSAVSSGDGVQTNGGIVTITAAGTYVLQGTLTDGQIIVDTADADPVRLILNGVDLRSSTSAPIVIDNAEKAIIILADNTQNSVTDGASYVFADPETDEPNAAIFSNSDLTIGGNGTLTVNGNYNDGISSDDGLIIESGMITVNAADDGIRGKDYLVINNGNITVQAQGDGLKADNDEDAAAGYLSISMGTINVVAGGDALQAETDILIAGGELNLTAGGGSDAVPDEAISTKGIKAGVLAVIDGGNFTIDSSDDAVHSNADLTINGGTFAIQTGDDGMHADATLTINNGTIRIAKSYEGIESAVITINAGDIALVASDDGINVAAGNDGSGSGGGMGGRPAPDTFAASGSNFLYINGGSIVVDASGDGLDANGSIAMTGGTVVVHGPTQNMNGALDYDGSFTISGGVLIAAGSAGMATAPDNNSTQYALLINSDTIQPAGTLVHIQTSTGEPILTFAPLRQYQSLVFSSPALQHGETYTVLYGGSATGTVQNGVYQDGTYQGGSSEVSFTISQIITQIGNIRSRFR